MKKIRILSLICALLALSLAFSSCGGGQDAPPASTAAPEQTPVKELTDGVITYENAVCESIINLADSGTVATAVASNGAPVSYALKDAAEKEKLDNAFASALSIDADGTIRGAFNAIKKIKVKIVASAEKCPSVEAEITVSVVNPHLRYVGRQLADARQGVEYAASAAYVEDDAAVTYTLEKGSSLPEGLSIDKKGKITSVPTKVGPGESFSITASAKGFSPTTAQFSIDVVIDHRSDTPSRIVNFGSKEGAKALETAYVGAQYVNQAGVAGNASALNGNHITYTLAEGGALPEGIELCSNGALIGIASDIAECRFFVTASADHCDPVTKEFTLSVVPRRIIFDSFSGELTKGEQANVSIAAAVAAEGVKITYTMTKEAADALKAEYGLEVTPEGTVTGTPTKVTELMSFKVRASAEGYTSVEATIYFRISEPLQAPANGRFEAEYTDLTGKNGTGYSASPSGTQMIDTSFEGLNISGGAFVNYMHNDTITLEFAVYAEKDVKGAPLYIQMSSEMGSVNLTPAGFGVYTYEGKTATGKKTTVDYGSVAVDGGNQAYVAFKEYRFGSVDLKQGWNVIQLAVHANAYRGTGADGSPITGGPGIDYIRIDAGTELKWIPCTYNIAS